MTDIRFIYDDAQAIIKDYLVEEIVAQGHHLTGAMEESIEGKTKEGKKVSTLEGFAVYYTQFVNKGVPAESVSFKQFPFLVEYFLKRGLEEKEAKGAAAATIRVWMKEGMPTQASKRFSSTGSRTNMIENAFVGASDKIDSYLTNRFDTEFEKEFKKEKSETI